MSERNEIDELEDLMKFADESELDEDIDKDIEEIILESVSSENVFTTSIFYVEETRKAHVVVSGENPLTYTEVMSPEMYLELCAKVDIYENNDYNLSISRKIGGMNARIFAITRPVSAYPNITISTSKKPPETWDDIELQPILEEITKHNFLLVGGSGSGKTYLLNYMLSQTHKGTDNKIGLIEEFNELIRPNDGTFHLSVPAAKPNEPRLLEFITEQSNLMRIDYLYVGEIKGSESWPFLNNLASGTKGATTTHGSSVREGLERFKNLCTLAGATEDAVRQSIAKVVKYVIHIENHKIMTIAELSGVHHAGQFQMKEVFSR